MTEFKQTVLDTYNTDATQLSVDQKNWNQLSQPVIVKEFTQINYVDACPSNTQLSAVSTGPKVVIYNCRSGRAVSTISRFQRTAHGGSYRQDGRLLVAGSEDSYVRLFDCRNNDQLRVYKGHKGPVHRVKFLEGLPGRIVSFSDDKTCGVWDIPGEKKIMDLTGHTDNIRSGCVNQSCPYLVMSGSHDRTVRVWDTRTGEAVFTLDHGSSHVNDVICYPGGTVLATAAGSEVRIWDLAGGKLLSKLCRHHKDVTSLCLATGGSRLLSASLDHHIKVYDVNTYTVVHTMQCAASVLSFAVMPEDSGLVVGMIAEGKGVISLQKKVYSKTKATEKTKTKIENSTIKVIQEQRTTKLSRADDLLRKFEHTRFLDLAFNSQNHAATVARLAELCRRGGLQSALAGRDESSLRRVFRFLYKNFTNYAYQAVLAEVVVVLLDVYGNKITADSPLLPHINKLYDMVSNEMKVTCDQVKMEGSIKATANRTSDSSICRPQRYLPSQDTIEQTEEIALCKELNASNNSKRANVPLPATK